MCEADISLYSFSFVTSRFHQSGFSYLSFSTVDQIFRADGLSVFDVEELDTNGGSLRVFAQRTGTGKHPVSERVMDLLDREAPARMNKVGYYQGFQEQAREAK